MPTSAVIHIQKIAPGPPRKMAVATPAILPVPIVADSSVISALNGVISPLPSLTRPRHRRARLSGTLRMLRARKPTVR